MKVQVTTPSMVRGAGVAAAMLVPGHGRISRLVRTGVVGASYVASFSTEQSTHQPVHYAMVSFDGDDNVPDEVKQYAPMVIGTASWIGIQAVVGHIAALLPLPKSIKALLTGGAVALGDGWVNEKMSPVRPGTVS